jgi:hypothetical protein
MDEERVLEWLGLDKDFRGQVETEQSHLDDLLSLVFPNLSPVEIDNLGTETVKLKLLFGSAYCSENLMYFDTAIRVFTPRELGFILLDLHSIFCDQRYDADIRANIYEMAMDEIFGVTSEGLTLKMVLKKKGDLATVAREYRHLLYRSQG